MLTNRLIIHWFSGTGNTLWALRRLQEHLEEGGMEVELVPLPAPPPALIPEGTALGMAFPVYAQSPPPFVIRWIQELPAVSKPVPVVVMTTLAGMSGLVKQPVANILRAKGYEPWAVREIKMPPNYIHLLDDTFREAAIRKVAEGQIAEFAADLAAGTVEWPKRLVPMVGLTCAQKVFRPIAAWLGKGFRADEKRCNQCGLCVKLCPVGNISFNPPAVPTWAGKCEQCLRCVNYCPKKAIKPQRWSWLYQPSYRCPEVSADDLLGLKAGEGGGGLEL